VMSFRLTPDTRAALRSAAARSGRSLSQETEHRLRRGLDEEEATSSLWGDVKTSAMLRLAAQVVQSVRTLQDTKVHWTVLNCVAFPPLCWRRCGPCPALFAQAGYDVIRRSGRLRRNESAPKIVDGAHAPPSLSVTDP
jgi:hypothetical protein